MWFFVGENREGETAHLKQCPTLHVVGASFGCDTPCTRAGVACVYSEKNQQGSHEETTREDIEHKNT